MQRDSIPDVPPDFGHWLAGFVDGEGCFYIERRLTKYRTAFTFQIVFQIALRDDDAAVLREIQERTGLGKLRYSKAYATTQPAVRWYVVDKRELLQLVRLFDRYPLRAKKARDFAIWRQAVIYKQSVRRESLGRNGFKRADWGPVPRLCNELRRGRAYEPRPDVVEEPAEPTLFDLEQAA